uniref:Uncharacterized protein LOC111122635 n=1 Tax=Crassostrea virginica TaxID=6565 RepID=A0A8B8CY49_CRAVI|nr:uncharacterized protein LOC111122635 [Crassostrea virginica]
MGDVNHFLSEGYDEERSIRMALNKSRHLLEEMWDKGDETDFDDSSEEEDETENEYDRKYVLSKAKIRKWLQRQEAYSLQRGVRRRFKRNKVITLDIDDQWDVDLMDMSKFSKENSGFSFILVVIDIFSKFLCMRPLKDKKGQSVTAAFQDILQEGRHPSRLRSDKGQEFRSKAFNALLKDQTVELFYAQNTEIKANYAERVIKTMKAKLYRYITYKQSHRYVDKLQDFVKNYNATYHRTIGMAPVKVTKADETNLWWRKYFSFLLSERRLRGGIPIYRLKDYLNEDIKGTFYQSELQKVELRESDVFKVAKILKTKGRGRNKQYFVKWLHWTSKFNSWINAGNLQTFT